MDFPVIDLMDEQACDDQLAAWLHPDGMTCPRCHRHDRMAVHRRGRAPILDFRRGHCRRVFNAFTSTALQGSQRRPRELVLILRGFAQAVPTAQLARELDCDRAELLRLRHRLQDLAFRNRDIMPLDDPVPEADEAFQNTGKKGMPHLDPESGKWAAVDRACAATDLHDKVAVRTARSSTMIWWRRLSDDLAVRTG